jgi:hypothetical protein
MCSRLGELAHIEPTGADRAFIKVIGLALSDVIPSEPPRSFHRKKQPRKQKPQAFARCGWPGL